MKTEKIHEFLIDLLELVHNNDLSLTHLKTRLYQAVKTWSHLTDCSDLIDRIDNEFRRN